MKVQFFDGWLKNGENWKVLPKLIAKIDASRDEIVRAYAADDSGLKSENVELGNGYYVSTAVEGEYTRNGDADIEQVDAVILYGIHSQRVGFLYEIGKQGRLIVITNPIIN